jgi:two-component system sensor histidine kinase/response regulator
MDQPAVPPQASILVVDDSSANLQLLNRILTSRGYSVQLASNGAQGLEFAQVNPPDLILLDIMMPGMNGYETCERIKADDQTRDIPVLFISALDATEDKVKAFEIGGEDYVPKPFEHEEVLARVATHLALRRLQKQLEAANHELALRLDELHQANAALQERNAELDAFAHTVAHDLKNPLATIMGYAELLSEYSSDKFDRDTYESMQNIAKTSHKMNSIIHELLLLSQVRKSEVAMARLDMAVIVAEVQQRLDFVIGEYQADITTRGVWPEAMGHAPWVEEVLVNYLSNALKYGGSPQHVELGGEKQPDGMARFWVRDNGKGLTPEQQAQLFAPFTQLDQARAQGHGLGLSIVRRIVEKLGGQVSVESQVGEGSTFFFTLPAAPAQTC